MGKWKSSCIDELSLTFIDIGIINVANISTYITLTLNVAHCKFTSLLGNAYNDDANGGAIVLDSLTEVYIRECIFLNNTSPWLGGAIYYDITDVFRCGQNDNNRIAKYYGGAMELNGYKHFTLYNSSYFCWEQSH